jgi:hypothetical protein
MIVDKGLMGRTRSELFSGLGVIAFASAIYSKHTTLGILFAIGVFAFVLAIVSGGMEIRAHRARKCSPTRLFGNLMMSLLTSISAFSVVAAHLWRPDAITDQAAWAMFGVVLGLLGVVKIAFLMVIIDSVGKKSEIVRIATLMSVLSNFLYLAFSWFAAIIAFVGAFFAKTWSESNEGKVVSAILVVIVSTLWIAIEITSVFGEMLTNDRKRIKVASVLKSSIQVIACVMFIVMQCQVASNPSNLLLPATIVALIGIVVGILAGTMSFWEKTTPYISNDVKLRPSQPRRLSRRRGRNELRRRHASRSQGGVA